MDKMLKNELSLSKRMKIMIALGTTFFMTLSVVFCVLLYSNARTTVRGHAIRSFTNICQLNEDSLTRAFQNREKLMQTIADRLMKHEVYDVDEILDELEDFSDAYDCYNMGVLDRKYFLHRTNGTSTYVAGMSLTKLIWDEKPHITSSYFPSDSTEYMVNMFSHPVFKDGELNCIIIATYYSKDLVERMNINSLKGKGFTFLLNEQSEVVIYPQKYEDKEYNALMKFINDDPDIVPDENGDCYFFYNGSRYFAHFEKLGVNDWYLMTCAREADVFAEARIIISSAFIGLGVMWILVTASILIVFYSVFSSRERLRKTFFYDNLLGIGNENALSVCFRKIPPERLHSMYLVAFDVDRFKEFNYLYGDEKGDELLKYIVKVFQDELPDVYLFRYEADYFITLDSSRNSEEIEHSIQKILDRFARDREKGVIQIFDTSAGIRKIEPGVSLRQLISDAIIAKDTIKGNHLVQRAFYEEKLRLKQMDYMEMESSFSEALKNKEFHVYYQPKYDMKTEKIIGAEALARWIRKDGALISPGAFIPCFEASRQIILLDEVMLREVCFQMKEMENEGLDVKPVSVNLSRIHLQHPDILSKIAAIIRESGIDPANLAFEITESALLEENIPLKDIVDHLHSLGCRVDMDDYGVGASTPNNLAFNSFDVIKLDKSFVDGIGNERAEDIIQATITLAKKWDMEILAEGIEEKYQADILMKMGCVQAQGFYYSRPVPEDVYRKLLKAELYD